MYASYSLTKRLVLVHILAIQLIRCVSSLNLTNAYLHHKCLPGEGNYKPGSKYEKDLNIITRRLSAHSFPDGFRHISYGDAPNSVSVIFQCRGDSYRSFCRSCFSTALAGLRRKCPSNKAAIIWYDQCFLAFSTIKSSTRAIDYKNTFSMHNPNNVVGDKESFNKNTRDFLNELMLKAATPSANSSSLQFYAAAEKTLGTKKLYGMMQCAQDITECKGCLEWNIKELSKCCEGKQGARVLSTTCNLRYELYPFLRT